MRTLVLALALGLLSSSAAHARPSDPLRPWLLEGSLGTIQPGPGTNLGAGQSFGGHLGHQFHPSADLSLSLGWAQARVSSQAIETSILSGGLRLRGFAGAGRWWPYAGAGAGLQSLRTEQLSVASPSSRRTLRAGGHLGAGVLYARSTWWGGLGAELHGSLGEAVLDESGFLTYTTFNVFLGQSLGW